MKHSRSRHSEITRDRLDYSQAGTGMFFPLSAPRRAAPRAERSRTAAERIPAIFNENKRTPSTTNIRTGRSALRLNVGNSINYSAPHIIPIRSFHERGRKVALEDYLSQYTSTTRIYAVANAREFL